MSDTTEAARAASALMERILYEVKRVVVGQDRFLERVMVALLAQGHLLVEGVPGLAKTLTVRTLAATLRGSYKRIQFTPDLVPADLVGTRIYNQKTGEFGTTLGPVFAHLLLADEINRAPAKVQSALLEVMQERQVTIAGEPHRVPAPFVVMATQNPIETEGTYPLPEAQLDRFMMKVLVDYPDDDEEFVIVERVIGAPIEVEPVASMAQLLELQQECRKVYVDPSLITYAVKLVGTTRRPDWHGLPELARYLSFGASPRASIALVEGARALAWLRGRGYVLPQDLTDLAADTLRHRLVLSYEALAEGLSADDLIERVMKHVPVPARPMQHPGLTMAEHDRPTADALLRRLEWTVLRRLDGLLQGDHRTLWRGGGLDLADLREYQHGDDVRHIDWNVTARLQVPHVRQYTEDRDLTAWFLVDLTGSIEFGSAERTKREVAEELVALLARLITRHGNRVGALLYGLDGAGQPPRLVPPGVGRRQVLALVSRLRESAAPGARVTVLGDLLRAADGLLRRRSLVFVVSDFISEPGWDDALGRLARRHEVMALRLYDPLEMTLPDLGLLTLADAETGEQLQVDTADAGFRSRFKSLAGQAEHALREALARAGVDTLEVTTADDLLTTVLRYTALRRQRLRARPGIGMPADLAPARPMAAAEGATS